MDGHAIYTLTEERTDIGRKTMFVSEHVIKAPVTSWWKSQSKRWAGGCGKKEESSRLEISFWKSFVWQWWQRSPVGDVDCPLLSLVWPM